jgi:hypothetical protein
VLFLPTPAAQPLKHDQRLLLAVETVQAVRPLKLEGRGGFGRVGEQLDGSAVVVRVEVEEEKGLECGEGRGVEVEDWFGSAHDTHDLSTTARTTSGSSINGKLRPPVAQPSALKLPFGLGR